MSNDINDCFKITGNDIIVKVKIVPGSSKNKIIGVYNNALKIYIAAPPVERKANKKCIAYLAEYFDIAKSKIEIISGQTSKNKLIKIYDISEKDFLEKIEKIS
ncbi:YggU family protein [bacterium]|nr:YggU family protein [bacterium]